MSNTSRVTPDGDIVIHNRGGFSTPVNFTDSVGAPRNVSAHTIKFITSEGHSITLSNGGSTDEKILTITEAQLETALNKSANFAVVDETSTPDEVVWEGRLFVVGW